MCVIRGAQMAYVQDSGGSPHFSLFHFKQQGTQNQKRDYEGSQWLKANCQCLRQTTKGKIAKSESSSNCLLVKVARYHFLVRTAESIRLHATKTSMKNV